MIIAIEIFGSITCNSVHNKEGMGAGGGGGVIDGLEKPILTNLKKSLNWMTLKMQCSIKSIITYLTYTLIICECTHLNHYLQTDITNMCMVIFMKFAYEFIDVIAFLVSYKTNYINLWKYFFSKKW